MKKFVFKLDALLKVREFAEKRVKAELGVILKQIQDNKEEIEKLDSYIDDTYEEQQAALTSGLTGRHAGFYSWASEHNREQIRLRSELGEKLQRQYDQKLHELKIAMGEVTVVENMKTKHLEKFEKEQKRKEQEDLEEKFSNSSFHKDKLNKVNL